MKRVMKICFMAAVALLIPGVILCAAGTIAGGRWADAFSRNNVISGSKPFWGWSWNNRDHDAWDWDWDDDDWSEGWNWSHGSGTSVAANDPSFSLSGSDSRQIPHQTGEIQKLDFTVQVGHLELTLGDDFAVNTDGCDALLVDSTKEDGVWKLKVTANHSHDHNGHDGEDTVEVVLPRDTWYDTVDLECSAGAITGEELACGKLEVDVQAGSVQLRRVQTDSMDLSADAGSVDVSGTVTGTAAMEVNAGSVTLRTPKPEQYGYSVECNLGSVDLFGDVSTALYNRNVQNQDVRPFFDLEVNTGKAVVMADDTL